MRLARWAVVGVVVIGLAACRKHESVTGGYGAGVVTGQVVMAAGTSASPEGVRVSVVGTGMSTLLGPDGRFTFTGVPDEAELHFMRNDGIDARLGVPATGRGFVVELNGTTAKKGRQRAAPIVVPLEIEGVIASAAPDSLVITTEHNGNVTVKLTDATIIRKGQTAIKAADLKAGDQVHVKATVNGDVKTAVEVIVQNEGKDDGNANDHGDVSASGIVKSVGASSLVLTTAKGDLTVQVDPSTLIKRNDQKITLADIKVGDAVAAEGTRVDDHTLKAATIEVRSKEPDHQEIYVTGIVKSVGAVSLVITTSKGDVTVQVDSSTIIRKNDQKITLADIKVGDAVTAEGTRVDDHTLKAATIEVRGKEPDQQEMYVTGIVKSVGASSLVVATSKGDVTVQVDASTIIEKDDKRIALADIHAGDQISAEGTPVDGHTLAAAKIEVRGKGHS